MSFFREFKTFAMRGNVLDMAVGIIIGAAFGRIVNSLVNDVLMPPLGLLLARMDFSDMVVTLKPAVTDSAGAIVTPAVTIGYGTFINAIINFVIVALAVFLLVKMFNAAYQKEKPAPPAPPSISKEEQLLTDIRDILQARS